MSRRKRAASTQADGGAAAAVVLPDGVFLQQPLHRHGQLPQEAFDDGPTLGELVLDFDLQDVGGQGHEVKPLETDKGDRK